MKNTPAFVLGAILISVSFATSMIMPDSVFAESNNISNTLLYCVSAVFGIAGVYVFLQQIFKN